MHMHVNVHTNTFEWSHTHIFINRELPLHTWHAPISTSFSCFPISSSFVMQNAVVTVNSAVSSAEADCAKSRVQDKNSGCDELLKKMDVDVLQWKKHCTLQLPKYHHCVTTCCDIQCISPFTSCSSLASLSQYLQQDFFLLQESIARHYLCDGHKDFVSFEKQQLCRAISSCSSSYCGTLCVQGT